MRQTILISLLLAPILTWMPRVCWAEDGLAAGYPNDQGLAGDPDVLYFLDFDDQQATMDWSKGKTGYGWTDAAEHTFAGGGALEVQQTTGTHDPYEIHPEIEESDLVYVRWYRKWEVGYDFTQHKMSGVYAKAPDATGAGEKPTGYDKYSCKLYVDFDGYPRFYTYHPDQEGIYGDGLHMNLADPKIKVEADRWYCFEMMIKANQAPAHDGELKMWIDGELVGHYTDMRFRETNELKINQFTYSAYVGGSWTSERDQKLWDDQIVVARKYIGPLVTEARVDGPVSPPADGGVPVDGGVPADRGPGPDAQGPTQDRGHLAPLAPRPVPEGCVVATGRLSAASAGAWALLLLLLLWTGRRPR